jgi:hypothetical protein
MVTQPPLPSQFHSRCTPEFSIYLQQPLWLYAAHQEALKKEIERLRQIYHQQSLENAEAPTTDDDDPAIRSSSDKDLTAAAPS